MQKDPRCSEKRWWRGTGIRSNVRPPARRCCRLRLFEWLGCVRTRVVCLASSATVLQPLTLGRVSGLCLHCTAPLACWLAGRVIHTGPVLLLASRTKFGRGRSVMQARAGSWRPGGEGWGGTDGVPGQCPVPARHGALPDESEVSARSRRYATAPVASELATRNDASARKRGPKDASARLQVCPRRRSVPRCGVRLAMELAIRWELGAGVHGVNLVSRRASSWQIRRTSRQ